LTKGGGGRVILKKEGPRILLPKKIGQVLPQGEKKPTPLEKRFGSYTGKATLEGKKVEIPKEALISAREGKAGKKRECVLGTKTRDPTKESPRIRKKLLRGDPGNIQGKDLVEPIESV